MSATARAVLRYGVPPGRPWLRARHRRHVLGLALVAPAFVLVCGLVVYPIAYDVVLALTDAEGFNGPGRFVGSGNR